MRGYHLVIMINSSRIIAICLLGALIQLSVVGQKNPPDTEKNAGAVVFSEALKLFEENTPDSYRSALLKFRDATRIFVQSGDKNRQAVSMLYAAVTEDRLGGGLTAIKAYNAALPILREAGDGFGVAIAFNNIGLNYYNLGENQKAIHNYEEALLITKRLNIKEQEAQTLANLAALHESTGNIDVALEFYLKALRLYRDTRLKKQESYLLSVIGGIYDQKGQLLKAIRYLNESLSISRALKDRVEEARTLIAIGQSLDKVGDRRAALRRYTDALLINREILDRTGEALALASIGLIYHIGGEMKKAEDLYSESLNITRSTGDKEGEAAMLLAFGLFLNSTSEFEKASESFQRASELCSGKDKMCEASTQFGLGMAFQGIADYEKSIHHFTVAIQLSRLIGFTEAEIGSLNGLGQIFYYLGLNQKAIEHFGQALRISEAIDRKDSQSVSLGNLGLVYFALEDYARALEYQKKASSIAEKARNLHLQGYGENNLGLTLVEMKKAKESIKYFQKALVSSRIMRNRTFEATVLLNLGYAYSEMGEHELALKNLNESLSIARIIEDPNVEAFALGTIGLSWYQRKNLRFAAFYGKQAVNIVQGLRMKIRGFDQETQKAFIKRFEKSYRKLADIFVEMGRIAEAEHLLGMLKEEEYFDFVRRDDKVANELSAQMRLSPDEQKAFNEYKKYADSLTALGKELGELQSESKRYEAGEFPKQKRLDELEKQIAGANKVFTAFLDNLKAQFNKSDVRVANLESGSQSILKELNQPRTVMISTIAGDDRLNLIVTTSDTQRAHTVNIKAADLNKLVHEFRSDVNRPRVDPRVAGKKLYDILFPASLQKDLEGVSADTIVWSLDGTLRYVPIAALWDGKQYLVEKYKNVLITLASRNAIGRIPAERNTWKALGVGVSKEITLKDVDGTPRNFEALISVPGELCGVIADPDQNCSAAGGATGILAGKSLLDDSFTLPIFKNNLGRYSVVHIASHFYLNEGSENDSYLLLGGGEEKKWTLAAVRQGGAQFVGVELLTLSACKTAMSSGNRTNGVEVEGFGVLAQNQGAKAVLASLWSVADNSTRDLMIEFYKQLEGTPRINKAEALQKAQLSLLRGNYKLEDVPPSHKNVDNVLKRFKSDGQAPFAHPYYWSPFILMGNWQ